MVDPLTFRQWSYRALFLLISALVMFLQLLPFNLGHEQFAGPSWLVLLSFAWVLRRPDYVPILLIAVVLFMADILFMRPLGLLTLLTLFGAEFLRNRGHLSAELPFLVEWAMVSVVLLAMAVGNGVILAILLVPQPPFGPSAVQVVASVAIYPVVVAVTAFIFGVRPPTPSERDAIGAQT